ncbi:hypothetical protein [Niabella hibiscisoli]|uniref:hypothetical protein n=1 Tax=Niabella hibiscisoli TaxID=1825928 RepID=UPI001F0DB05D|nr:hypothetical protein [Niabella hibiscisoli]MCH5716672.1 hypothetical protein [Niabella hibiscisoli]
MKSLIILLLFAIHLVACKSKNSKSITDVKSVVISNVGEFIITDSSLAKEMETVDTIPENSLDEDQLNQLVPLRFDSAIGIQVLKNYASYDQVLNELVAR